MAEEVKLFGMWASRYSCRVKIALKLKGIEYEYIEEDLANKSPLLVMYNPVHKKIPVLLHNGKPICESLVILEYIDETWKGTPILPEDPHKRAMARFWAKFIDEKRLLECKGMKKKLHESSMVKTLAKKKMKKTWENELQPAHSFQCLPAIVKAFKSNDEEEEKAMEEASEVLKTLEGQLNDKKFFGGDTVGLVDIVANLIGFWLQVTQQALGVELLTEEKFPRLCKWVDEYVNCNAVKESLPPREKLFAYAKAKNIRPSQANSAPKY